MKSRTSLNFGQIGPLTKELAALERLKKSHRLIMGKCCLGPDQTTHLLLHDENFTLSNMNITEASWPILIKFYV